jgi:hypothetical protein
MFEATTITAIATMAGSIFISVTRFDMVVGDMALTGRWAL